MAYEWLMNGLLKSPPTNYHLVMTNIAMENPNHKWRFRSLGKSSIDGRIIYKSSMTNHLVMTNSSPWFFDGPNRNRWFTVIKNGWIFPWQTGNVITRWYIYERTYSYIY